MTEKIDLTPTSYIVLGMLSMYAGEATPYDLKRMVAASVGQFWTLPHAMMYSEPARLARGGYVTENQEQNGRRRKRYGLTDSGRAALEEWLQVVTPEIYVIRDLALLKLFFGADKQALAEAQLEILRTKLAEHEAMAVHDPGDQPGRRRGPWEALKFAIRHHNDAIGFWEEQAQADKPRATRGKPAKRKPRPKPKPKKP
jgi:PadR family transcriptional regulator, regulatory protein AphA